MVDKATVGRVNVSTNVELSKAELNKVERDTKSAQGNQRQDNKTNKETLSASEYELVAQAHETNKTMYDQPQGNQRLAISSYQSVLHAPKREEIQRLVGIDTFA